MVSIIALNTVDLDALEPRIVLHSNPPFSARILEILLTSDCAYCNDENSLAQITPKQTPHCPSYKWECGKYCGWTEHCNKITQGVS